MLFKTVTLVAGLSGALAFAYAAGVKADWTGADSLEDPRLAVAKTMLHSDTVAEKARKLDREQRRKSFLERKAKEEAKEKAIRDLVQQAPPPRQSMKRLCKNVVDDYNAYQERQHADNDRALVEWYGQKRKTLSRLNQQCRLIDDRQVASCFSHALQNVPTEHGDIGRDILKECAMTHNPQAMERVWKNSMN